MGSQRHTITIFECPVSYFTRETTYTIINFQGCHREGHFMFNSTLQLVFTSIWVGSHHFTPYMRSLNLYFDASCFVLGSLFYAALYINLGARKCCQNMLNGLCAGQKFPLQLPETGSYPST